MSLVLPLPIMLSPNWISTVCSPPTPCQLIFCVWTPTASLPKESKKATFW